METKNPRAVQGAEASMSNGYSDADASNTNGTETATPDFISPDLSEKLVYFLKARAQLDGAPENRTRVDEEVASAAYFHTEEQLLAEPARNIHDLRLKCDVIWLDPQALPGTGLLSEIFSDLRRLTGGGMSLVFRPKNWLEYYERRGGAWVVRGDEVFLLTPKGADLDDLLYELDAAGGREAVFDLIRKRSAIEENADG
jgi:hypothetical protein